MLEQTLGALARQGISKEAYLQIAGKDEETMAREAEPEAAKALRREAVLAAIVEAEHIEPTDEKLLEELEPSAERTGTSTQDLLERVTKNGSSTGFARTWPRAWPSTKSSSRPYPSALSRPRRARSSGPRARTIPRAAAGSSGPLVAEPFPPVGRGERHC